MGTIMNSPQPSPQSDLKRNSGLPQEPSTSAMWLLVLPIMLLILDLGVLLAWDSLKSAIGSWLGVELGLLIFLNILGGFLVLEYLETRNRPPKMFSWYYRLPLGVRSERIDTSPPQVSGFFGYWKFILILTLGFFIAENFLFPLFLPPAWGVAVDIAMVGVIIWCRFALRNFIHSIFGRKALG